MSGSAASDADSSYAQDLYRRTQKDWSARLQTDVPHWFLASVPLFATSSTGGRWFLGHVVAAGRETSFRFHTSGAPHKILIDPQMTLLCTTE